jgi:thiol:disulfide interchange protein DsbD
MNLPGGRPAVLALLRPMPWLNLPIAVFNKPSTSLDTSSEPRTTKSTTVYPSPHHLDIFFDYEEGLAYSRRAEKPVLIHFTGHHCVQSRDMEMRVWSDPDVLGYLHNEYVVIQLYVDDGTPLPLREHAISPHTGRAITTLGHRWGDLQARRFGTDAQPYYVVLSPSGKELIPGTGAEYDIDRYSRFLAEGVKAFRSRSKSIL